MERPIIAHMLGNLNIFCTHVNKNGFRIFAEKGEMFFAFCRKKVKHYSHFVKKIETIFALCRKKK